MSGLSGHFCSRENTLAVETQDGNPTEAGAVDQGVRERAADLDETCESRRASGEKTVALEKIKEWRYSGQDTALMYL